MHELLRALAPGAVVLDIGCGRGSFETQDSAFTVIRTDLARQVAGTRNFVQSDAARLPFAHGAFHLIVSNNSLEHFDNLEGALREIGRVVKPDGALYVAVPDATTLSDRLYRWLAHGGGHVNPFVSPHELANRIAHATGLPHVATRTLCTSLACLNRRNRTTWAPRRLLLFGGGTQTSLLLINYLLRLADRLLGTRASVYGWVFYFGSVAAHIDCDTWSNVCVRCGAGHPSGWLRDGRMVRKRWGFFTTYRCPGCQTLNLFTDDRNFARLHHQPKMS